MHHLNWSLLHHGVKSVLIGEVSSSRGGGVESLRINFLEEKQPGADAETGWLTRAMAIPSHQATQTFDGVHARCMQV